jgi:aminoglycoside phosphotransferase (APT) family kinase protein
MGWNQDNYPVEPNTEMESPSLNLAREIAATFAGKRITKIARFETGLCHFVYDVCAESGQRFVIRIAQPANERLLKGARYWLPLLADAGVPVARILQVDLDKRLFPFAYLILERLDGRDLGEVYQSMSRAAKRRLAERITEIQGLVTRLPESRRFGDSVGYDSSGGHDSWHAVIMDLILRCKHRVEESSVLILNDVTRLEVSAIQLAESLDHVAPRPFLDDATTKNVIVSREGVLSGIVDTDTVCYGDHLFTLALTKAAFAKSGFDTVYTDTWTGILDLDEESRLRLSFYTALFAAVILSEQGQKFNQDEKVAFERSGIQRLRGLLEQEVEKVTFHGGGRA